MKTTRAFRVASRSSNANSFGLYGHIMIASDGEGWEVARAIGSGNPDWPKGTDVQIPYDTDNGGLQWGAVSCEIPRQLPICPAVILKDVFPRNLQSSAT